MANTGSKIYRTLRLFKNGVRSEHVKPNDARDPNYIPPFTDINSCFTDAPTPAPVPIPTPAPAPQPTPVPVTTPVAAPTALPPSPAPAPVSAPGVIPTPAPVFIKPPVVPTPVGGGVRAYLSGPTQISFGLCAINYSMTLQVNIAGARISEALNKVVSRNGIAYDGNDKWYAAAVARDLTTGASLDWYAIKIDNAGIIREIAEASTICRDGRILDTIDDGDGPVRRGNDGVLDDNRGPGLL